MPIKLIKINYGGTPNILQHTMKIEAFPAHLNQAYSLKFGHYVEAVEIQTWHACLAEHLSMELPVVVEDHGLAGYL